MEAGNRKAMVELPERKQWDDIYINTGKYKMYSKCYISSPNAKNIIVIHTPVISTKYLFKAYQLLGEKYGFNVFAIDYVPGLGNSTGKIADFTLPGMIEDIDTVYDYIENTYNSNIYMLGYTGIGGIFAQYYMSVRNRGNAFAQFACAIYQDTSSLGYPKWLIRILMPFLRGMLKINANLKMNFKEPEYHGKYADEDNAFYEEVRRISPDFEKPYAIIMLRLLECVINKNSCIKTSVKVPTLVFQTLHDRYFPNEYFKKYYDSLECEKRLAVIDNAHNSYYYAPDLFCSKSAEWFELHF